ASSPAAGPGPGGGGLEGLMRSDVAGAREFSPGAKPFSDYLARPGKPILETMLRIYGGLLDEIERRRYDVFSRRVELSRWRKICLTASTLARHKLHAFFHGS